MEAGVAMGIVGSDGLGVGCELYRVDCPLSVSD